MQYVGHPSNGTAAHYTIQPLREITVDHHSPHKQTQLFLFTYIQMVHSVDLDKGNLRDNAFTFLESHTNTLVLIYKEDQDLNKWAQYVLLHWATMPWETKGPKMGYAHRQDISINHPQIFETTNFQILTETEFQPHQITEATHYFSTIKKEEVCTETDNTYVILYYKPTCKHCNNTKEAWNNTVLSMFYERTCEFLACTEECPFTPPGTSDIRSFPTIHRISVKDGNQIVVDVFDHIKYDRTTINITRFAHGIVEEAYNDPTVTALTSA